ncbi:MAG: MBL fold metallo-hydrolase [Chloroflexi bacterium]|nr:MBL fold metallo-hydrolase [Chloroflexota bacterium]
MLKIITFTLGPAFTNAYLLADTETGEAVVIDPAWDGHLILREADSQGWTIQALWYTHAHFDHFGGAAAIAAKCGSDLTVAMHPDDLPLWGTKGGAALFGLNMESGPKPNLDLDHEQVLTLGAYSFSVRFAPGHSLGHVIFYCAAEALLFSGDVVFQGSIGRTDLPGGSYDTLIHSIRKQVLTLPNETRILSGHGPETNVGNERKSNPFLH